MKTIKQLSDETGLSKTTINKKLKDLNLLNQLKKQGNKFLIDDEQEILIMNSIEEDLNPEKNTKIQQNDNDMVENDDELASKQTNYNDFLFKQLKIKDDQIASLNKQNKELTKTLNILQSQQATIVKALSAASKRHLNNIQTPIRLQPDNLNSIDFVSLKPENPIDKPKNPNPFIKIFNMLIRKKDI